MQLEVRADLNVVMGPTGTVRGPIVFTATANPTFQAGVFERAEVAMHGEFGGLEMHFGDAFHKGKNVPADFDLKLVGSTK
ncbi:hypothetical protein ACI3PL_21195, partial [Lacticaseibacillus paracasei]